MDPSNAVAHFFERPGLAQTTGVIAVSGGPDSVALTHLLVGLLRQGKLNRLILAHVNHQLRGDESDGDEAFVRQLPALMQVGDRVTCHCERVDVATIAKAERKNLESIARRERYECFAKLAEAEGAHWIATGHTADDQAETVLFRLLRGSGVLGLGAMPDCRPLDGARLVRPLLTMRRQAVLDYLHARQIPFRVDSSNVDLRFRSEER